MASEEADDAAGAPAADSLVDPTSFPMVDLRLIAVAGTADQVVDDIAIASWPELVPDGGAGGGAEGTAVAQPAKSRRPPHVRLQARLAELDEQLVGMLEQGDIRFVRPSWLAQAASPHPGGDKALVARDGSAPAGTVAFLAERFAELEALERAGATPSPLLTPAEAVAYVRRTSRDSHSKGEGGGGQLVYGLLAPHVDDPTPSRIAAVQRALDQHRRMPVPANIAPGVIRPRTARSDLCDAFCLLRAPEEPLGGFERGRPATAPVNSSIGGMVGGGGEEGRPDGSFGDAIEHGATGGVAAEDDEGEDSPTGSAEQIAAALRADATRQSLRVRPFLPTDTFQGAEELAEAVLSHPCLLHFNALPLHDLRQNALTELRVSGQAGGQGLDACAQSGRVVDLRLGKVGNGIGGVAGAIVLCSLLPQATSLTSLNLCGSGLTSDAAAHMAAALKAPMCTLRSLDLSTNRLTSLGASHLADALRTNGTLQSLDLSSNVIGAEGGAAIADALTKDNSTLTSLDLGNTQLCCVSNSS